MSTVSAVVPSFGDVDVVRRSLPRLLGSSACELEVVVVNNDGRQVAALRSLVAEIGDTRVRLLDVSHGAGFARAVNVGIAETSGELVFFANSDLFVTGRYVAEIASFFARTPRAGCATGKILRYDVVACRETDIIDTTGHVIARNRRVADRGENQRDIGQYEREEEMFSVSGAALVARRPALEAVKVRGEYLDESFDMYKEDIDLCWRLRLAGWECWYVPTAVAYHGRTSHGLGRRTYLSSIRAFHENEKRKPGRARMNSMKNQWLMLAKNDDIAVRDVPYVLGREALILGYNVVFSPRDAAKALWQFARALPRAVAARREFERLTTGSRRGQVRRWFLPGSHPG